MATGVALALGVLAIFRHTNPVLRELVRKLREFLLEPAPSKCGMAETTQLVDRRMGMQRFDFIV